MFTSKEDQSSRDKFKSRWKSLEMAESVEEKKSEYKGENSRGCIPELPGQSGEWSGDHIRKSWANLWIYPSLHFRPFFLGAAHRALHSSLESKYTVKQHQFLHMETKITMVFCFLSFFPPFFFFSVIGLAWRKWYASICIFFLSQNLLCEQRICSNWLGGYFLNFLERRLSLHLLWALGSAWKLPIKSFHGVCNL